MWIWSTKNLFPVETVNIQFTSNLLQPKKITQDTSFQNEYSHSTKNLKSKIVSKTYKSAGKFGLTQKS